jgi:AraC family transcriptional regulator of adaptative response/methylated-DNA-[protein]-cysteine methyltransferase
LVCKHRNESHLEENAREMNAPGKTISNNKQWQAVLARDAHMDSKFVYGVRSTGIYCRPSCPSRKPARTQVRFFSVPKVAELAGFRACRRCKPERAQGLESSASAQMVALACKEIERQGEEPVRLGKLAAQSGTTPHRLHRLFRKVLGITPRQFADAVRVRQLKGRLRSGADVTTALYDAGYGSASRLYEHAHSQLGMTPATYKKGGLGMDIAYTIEDCPLGRVMVAATSRGISAVYLGDDDRPLERALREEYPKALIRHDAGVLGSWVKTIVKHLHGGGRHLNLPLDVEATAFQRRVWEELQKIPFGTTQSYNHIARAIGKPRATRAVARACATNPVSIVVPCHRVVRADGQLAGYRWGLKRKRALLEQEQQRGN